MLPKKLHIQEIDRFHDTFTLVNKKIEDIKKGEVPKANHEETLKLLAQYYELSKLWQKINDFIEYTIKQELDSYEDNR